MAWRIDEAVIRGEIDNRVRDRVTGRIWLAGCADPIEFDLAGNCWRDLAGRHLEFVNPEPQSLDFEGLAVRQTGIVGDITASRKVKVPTVSMNEFIELYKQRKPFPWHWGNSLYFEWFSDRNGRVVVESASFQLTVSPESAWDMTPDEEAKQRRANSEAMAGFMQGLGEAGAAERAAQGEGVDATPPEWNESPDVDAASEQNDATEPEAESEPTEQDDHAARDRPPHPLVARVNDAQFRFRREAEQRGWLPAGTSDEHPVADMVFSVRDAARKFAGALHDRTWPPLLMHCPDAIERLERGRGYLNHALLAAAYCEQEELVDPAWLAGLQREINTLVFECNALLAGLREHLRPEGESPDGEGDADGDG